MPSYDWGGWLLGIFFMLVPPLFLGGISAIGMTAIGLLSSRYPDYVEHWLHKSIVFLISATVSCVLIGALFSYNAFGVLPLLVLPPSIFAATCFLFDRSTNVQIVIWSMKVTIIVELVFYLGADILRLI